MGIYTLGKMELGQTEAHGRGTVMLLWLIGGYIASALAFYACIVTSAKEDTDIEPMANEEPRGHQIQTDELGQFLPNNEVRHTTLTVAGHNTVL